MTLFEESLIPRLYVPVGWKVGRQNPASSIKLVRDGRPILLDVPGTSSRNFLPAISLGNIANLIIIHIFFMVF